MALLYRMSSIHHFSDGTFEKPANFQIRFADISEAQAGRLADRLVTALQRQRGLAHDVIAEFLTDLHKADFFSTSRPNFKNALYGHGVFNYHTGLRHMTPEQAAKRIRKIRDDAILSFIYVSKHKRFALASGRVTKTWDKGFRIETQLGEHRSFLYSSLLRVGITRRVKNYQILYMNVLMEGYGAITIEVHDKNTLGFDQIAEKSEWDLGPDGESDRVTDFLDSFESASSDTSYSYYRKTNTNADFSYEVDQLLDDFDNFWNY